MKKRHKLGSKLQQALWVTGLRTRMRSAGHGHGPEIQLGLLKRQPKTMTTGHASLALRSLPPGSFASVKHVHNEFPGLVSEMRMPTAIGGRANEVMSFSTRRDDDDDGNNNL